MKSINRIRLFIETNLMLDLFGEREPFYLDSAKIATLADKGKIVMIASVLSGATVSYILNKFEGIDKTKEKLRKFIVIYEICEPDGKIIEKVLNSNFSD